MLYCLCILSDNICWVTRTCSACLCPTRQLWIELGIFYNSTCEVIACSAGTSSGLVPGCPEHWRHLWPQSETLQRSLSGASEDGLNGGWLIEHKLFTKLLKINYYRNWKWWDLLSFKIGIGSSFISVTTVSQHHKSHWSLQYCLWGVETSAYSPLLLPHLLVLQRTV